MIRDVMREKDIMPQGFFTHHASRIASRSE